MKWECPICKSEIIIERIDDGVLKVLVKREGVNFTELANKSNGSTSIYCSADATHDIPDDLQDELMDYFYEHY
jgi:hypothetical protein